MLSIVCSCCCMYVRTAPVIFLWRICNTPLTFFSIPVWLNVKSIPHAGKRNANTLDFEPMALFQSSFHCPFTVLSKYPASSHCFESFIQSMTFESTSTVVSCESLGVTHDFEILFPYKRNVSAYDENV